MWTEEYAGHSVDDKGFEADLAEWMERESYQRVTGSPRSTQRRPAC
jgi:hypothetical protein